MLWLPRQDLFDMWLKLSRDLRQNHWFKGKLLVLPHDVIHGALYVIDFQVIDSGNSCVGPASAYWLEYQSVSELYHCDSCPSPFPCGVRAQMSCKKIEKLYFVLPRILFPRFFILL